VYKLPHFNEEDEMEDMTYSPWVHETVVNPEEKSEGFEEQIKFKDPSLDLLDKLVDNKDGSCIKILRYYILLKSIAFSYL
jgi:hypothetical protein